VTSQTKNDAGPRHLYRATAAADMVLEAEADYHDCLGRFGHNSAEAHAAQIVWRQLRGRRLQIR